MVDKHEDENVIDTTVILEGKAVSQPAPCTNACLIVLTGNEIGRKIPLVCGEQIIGRAPASAICIPASSVSRQHARLTWRVDGDAPVAEVTDLHSSNGTQVNGEPVAVARLTNGDKIQLGAVVVKFVIEDPVDEAFHSEVHRRIHYNELTGLLTLASFREQFSGMLQTASPNSTIVVAMTDLDGLKGVNDSLGHLAGAKVIAAMGETIRSLLRPQDRAGLYGGDETVMCFPDMPLEQGRAFAERLRAAIEARAVEHDDREIRVTISQGLAEWPTHGHSIDQMIAAADGALYAAKAAGRNCVRCVGE